MGKFIDDQFTHLESDIEKIRVRHRQYISYSNEAGAKSVVMEIINNALDECRTPRSPGNRINIQFDERTGIIKVTDNGRGIPTDLLEKIYTSLNMGSNIDTSNKASLKTETLGQNGTGTLAICGLGEYTEVISYRGGTEDKFKRIIWNEGTKVQEEEGKCDPSKHGMEVYYKPSKVMGKNTKIVWDGAREFSIRAELLNLQYLNKKKINITADYYDKDGNLSTEKYKAQEFEEILLRNTKESIISNKIRLTVEEDNIKEELDGKMIKRFLSMDIAFVYTSSLAPYMDSFSNSNNTVDNGSHFDGTLEAICRFFQHVTKNSLNEREKQSLDIKWDDVKTGLSLVVALRTNFERLYTGQTKHKVVNDDIKKVIQDLTVAALTEYFNKQPAQLKEMISIVKMNAKARREGDKARTAVIKDKLTVWSSYKIKNYDPCTNRGKAYKELYIIEGDSAKGSLKNARDPRFQALFAIRGVSANVFKMDLDQVVKNEEFNGLIKVMNCEIGQRFDLSKLNFDKIIIASDADVDGLFIRSLLCSFYFKLYPEIIMDGRLFIAEPPLYRVGDKKNPFVINKEDYITRYINAVVKEYKVGYTDKENVVWLDKNGLREFLSVTSSYVDDVLQLSQHYKVKDHLIEMLIEELSYQGLSMASYSPSDIKQSINIQSLMNRIGTEFVEIFYDDKDKLIKGVIEGRYQLLEIEEGLIRKLDPLVNINKEYGPPGDNSLILRNIKTGTEHELSLLGILKILKKFQPEIEHRFKGLGENDVKDIKTTIMDPNTRTLIRVQISDIENDMKVFQTLRGASPFDSQCRKAMMRAYKIPRDLIDT